MTYLKGPSRNESRKVRMEKEGERRDPCKELHSSDPSSYVHTLTSSSIFVSWPKKTPLPLFFRCFVKRREHQSASLSKVFVCSGEHSTTFISSVSWVNPFLHLNGLPSWPFVGYPVSAAATVKESRFLSCVSNICRKRHCMTTFPVFFLLHILASFGE